MIALLLLRLLQLNTLNLPVPVSTTLPVFNCPHCYTIQFNNTVTQARPILLRYFIILSWFFFFFFTFFHSNLKIIKKQENYNKIILDYGILSFRAGDTKPTLFFNSESILACKTVTKKKKKNIS